MRGQNILKMLGCVKSDEKQKEKLEKIGDSLHWLLFEIILYYN